MSPGARWSVAPYFIVEDSAVPGGDAWDAYIWVDQVDALVAEFAARGVTPARDLCDQPYDCRDFDIIDCNGFRLCFGQDTSG